MKFRSIVALALALAFVGSPASAQVTPGTSPLSIVKGGAANCVADGVHVNLAAALVACASNAIILVPNSQTLSTVVTVAGSNVDIRCVSGATISVTTSGAIVNTGTNFKVEDCNITGPGTGTSGSSSFIQTTGDGFVLRNNVITNFGTGINGGIVNIINSSHVKVTGNRFQSTASLGIVGYNSSTGYTLTDWLISGNYIQNSFVLQDISAGSSTVEGIIVTDNKITTGGASTTEFCVEIGNFGAGTSGTVVKDISVANNNCQVLGSGVNGGISLANMQKATVTGNIIEGNGFGWTIEGIEYTASTVQGNGSSDATITGNHIEADGNQGIICGSCASATITGNVLRAVAGAANTWGIGLISNSTNGAGGGVISITGNMMDGVTSGTGILVNPQTSGNSFVDITVSGNTILGFSPSAGTGISFAPGAGTSLVNVMEGSNNISNINTGVNFASGIGAFCHTNDLISATTPVVNGTSTACH